MFLDFFILKIQKFTLKTFHKHIYFYISIFILITKWVFICYVFVTLVLCKKKKKKLHLVSIQEQNDMYKRDIKHVSLKRYNYKINLFFK